MKCMICNHYYFKDSFNYQPYVCDKCHDFSLTVMDLSGFFILDIKGNDYRVYITNIDKKEAMIIFKKSNLDDKVVFKELKDIDKKCFCSDFYDVNLNYYGVKVGNSLRFWENKGWINKIDPYGWLQWYFRYYNRRRSNVDKRQINRWKRIVSRFIGILKKLNSKGKDSKMIRQTLLH